MTTIVRSTLIVLLVSNNNTELATLHLFLVYCIGSRMVLHCSITYVTIVCGVCVISRLHGRSLA